MNKFRFSAELRKQGTLHLFETELVGVASKP